MHEYVPLKFIYIRNYLFILLLCIINTILYDIQIIKFFNIISIYI